jgi:hypothetical protein
MFASMRQDTDSGRATAAGARLNAALQDAAAARACVAQLERQVLAARMRSERLVMRLARIEGHARRAMAHTLDERARAALGDIVVTAADRDAPAVVA